MYLSIGFDTGIIETSFNRYRTGKIFRRCEKVCITKETIKMRKEIKELEQIASQVRRDIVRMVHGCQSGHPGGSLGCTDVVVALYFELMNRKEGFSMDGKGEDLFFLSNGHISPLFYSVLSRAGYFEAKELSSFR